MHLLTQERRRERWDLYFIENQLSSSLIYFAWMDFGMKEFVFSTPFIRPRTVLSSLVKSSKSLFAGEMQPGAVLSHRNVWEGVNIAIEIKNHVFKTAIRPINFWVAILCARKPKNANQKFYSVYSLVTEQLISPINHIL